MSAEAVRHDRVPWDWFKVFQSGLLTGLVLYLLPQGLPWAGLNMFSGAIMGREANLESNSLSFLGTLLHFVLAAGYACIVLSVARHVRVWRGVLLGSLMGVVCYGLNWVLTHFLLSYYAGHEGRVLVTHLAFGLYVTAIYKALAGERVKGIVQQGRDRSGETK